MKSRLEDLARDVLVLAAVLLAFSGIAQAQSTQPNILVLMPDDVGYFNVSAYNRGAMGYRTPNIDRIAKEGALFTDQYGQPSCTAGRASFITGMYPIRSGMTTVGMVGSPLGLKAKDATLAEVLKTQGYVTGQFGKNHLGDRNEHLPTVHGFDEFYGHLYHLNVLQEPMDNDYPKDKEFFAEFGPRGILHSWATDKDDPSAPDPRFGKVGKQRIEDMGHVTMERWRTWTPSTTRWPSSSSRRRRPTRSRSSSGSTPRACTYSTRCLRRTTRRRRDTPAMTTHTARA